VPGINLTASKCLHAQPKSALESPLTMLMVVVLPEP